MINKDLNIFKEKIEVYRHYLDVYLSIITKVSKVSKVSKDINVYEPLSGDGKDKHYYGEFQYDGSVKAAIKIIEKHRNDSKCEIRYFINDSGTNEYKRLLDEYKDYPWVYISKIDAKAFIDKHAQGTIGSHNLWFIDPYGYTQVEKNDITKIIYSPNSADIIIFFPTIFITRFISDPDSDETPAPIKKFFQDWGIEYQGKQDIKDPEVCEKIIKDAMKSNYNDCYICSYTLNKSSKLNLFSLFFISRHHLGAEKFLETKEKILEKDMQMQLSLSADEQSDNIWHKYEQEAEEPLKQYLEEEKTNKQLYIWSIRNGLLPKSLKKLLQKLEEKNIITIKPIKQGNKRRKNTFYVNRKSYEENEALLIYKIVNPNDVHNPDNDLFQSVPYPNK